MQQYKRNDIVKLLTPELIELHGEYVIITKVVDQNNFYAMAMGKNPFKVSREQLEYVSTPTFGSIANEKKVKK